MVGVVGPIGSGKTSILDAISFALYGRTPRIESGQKSLINQRRDALHVELVFDVDGDTYKAVRALRRGGASAHVLYRMTEGADVELTDRAREMTERVETLLGLDFDAFRRSVLLAQNRFADFLEATPKDRNQVLKGVFGFDRLDAMRAIAKERLDAVGSRLAVLTDRRATAQADRSDLEAKRIELKAAEERAAALEQLRTPFEEVKERIAAATVSTDEEQKRLERLDGLADRIPARNEADALFEAAESTGAAIAAAQEALTVAAADRAGSSDRLAEVLAPVGGKTGLNAAGDLVAAWKTSRNRIAEAEHAVIEATENVEKERLRTAGIAEALGRAQEALKAAAGDERDAIEALEVARASVQAARQDHRAHALRADLIVGEPCPVCEQQVADLPDSAAPPAVSGAEGVATTAGESVATAAAAARSASEEVARLRAEADGAKETAALVVAAAEAAAQRRNEAAQALGTTEEAAAARLGSGDPATALESLRSGVVDAEAALEAARSAEESARRQFEKSRAAASETAAALGTLRTDLATLSGLLESDVEVGEDPKALGEVLQRLHNQWKERRIAAETALGAAKEEAAAGRVALGDLLAAAGLGENDDVVEVISAAGTERTAHEAVVHQLEKRLADLEQLAQDESELVASSDLLGVIHTDLAPAKFLGFVLDERRRILGDLASEHLEVLTAGRYRFDDSGEFQMVDLAAADAIRSPASLSGGETFLASLALALSLAEIVAREGGRLDAFFLDEGFGSLDPEHLDLAMDGIERLVTTGPQRLVVVVSHVPALRERIEDLVVLDRDRVTGDTLIVSGASPP